MKFRVPTNFPEAIYTPYKKHSVFFDMRSKTWNTSAISFHSYTETVTLKHIYLKYPELINDAEFSKCLKEGFKCLEK
jgi:hypothetical protein